MRVFISSTSTEHEPHQAAAVDVVRNLGFEPVLRDPAAGRGLDPVRACARQIAATDVLLAIVGWCRGLVPPPEQGGDGARPWAFWEVRSAFERGKKVVILMAGRSWRPRPGEENPAGRAVMQDFRGELHRLAVFFEDDGGGSTSRSLLGFRELVRRELREVERDTVSQSGRSLRAFALRPWPTPRLPERPYPVLLPYSHPDLLAGRERELEDLGRLLATPVPIVGLYAPSGTGKSSLLAGGLIPRLRAAGRPVAFDRHPWEAGLAGRLLGDLLEVAGGSTDVLAVADEHPDTFVDRLRVVQRLSAGYGSHSQPGIGGGAPVLVLDQFEDLLHRGEARRARALVGTLLAASVQRLPGLNEAPCRWILAYREEFHGEIVQWLGDVLREARSAGLKVASTLPHDLSGPERFHSMPISPLGTPPPGSKDRTMVATRSFLAAIEKPLALTAPDGTPRYPWRFAPGHAARLAQAFGEARVTSPGAPLVPELQVVLSHLFPPDPPAGQEVVLEVPEDPNALIDRALEEHLRRALEAAFPIGSTPEARIGRTRALLALRELADVQGRRAQALPAESMARAIGAEGRAVLENLATPRTRLVVLEEHADGWCYVLSHDRMAELLVRLVDDDEASAALGVDAGLLGLRRFVALQSELFETSESESATEVSAAYFRRIEEHQEALLWGQRHQRWWAAAQRRYRADRRRLRFRRGIAAAVVLSVAWGTWIWADRRGKRQALLDRISEGDPEAAFKALAELPAEPADLLARWGERQPPFDVFEQGVGGVGEPQRAAAVLKVAELALPLVAEEPEDPIRIASLAWALDFFAAHDRASADRARTLRDAVLGPLRRKRPPPPWPGPEDPNWTEIPGGRFIMGTGADWDDIKPVTWGRPQHEVSVSGFRMLTHEVTNAEYRRLDPEHEGGDDLPAGWADWYEAYTYAAWLGGRLPTEAEWEYAARANCPYAYCTAEGLETTIDEVAWTVRNTRDPVTGAMSVRAVMSLAPNPWGLYDMLGNVNELTAAWYGVYTPELESDPAGPTKGTYRVARGGTVFWGSPASVHPTARSQITPRDDYWATGFRVVLPLGRPFP